MASKHNAVDSAASSPAVHIREYRPEDHAAVIALFTAGMQLYAADHGASWQEYIDLSIADDLARIHDVYVQPGGNFWVATIDSEVVGIVGLEAKPNCEGELRRMSIKTEARRFGVGRLLVAHLETWASAHGFAKVWLSTGGVMTQTQKSYASMGYEFTHTEPYMSDPSFEAVFFAKTLESSSAC